MAMNPRLLRPLSDFNPRQFAGLELWLDASDQSTMTLNGTTVEEWRSKAGTIALTQATAGAQPTLTQNYFGARSALTFDGGDVLYDSTAPLSIAPSTSFMVFDETTAVTFGGLFVASPSSGDDFSGNQRFVTTFHEGSPAQLIRRGVSPISAASTALVADFDFGTTGAFGKRLVTAISGTSTARLRAGGVDGTADTAHIASGSSAGTLVGGRFVGGAVSASFRFNGRICEILHYSQELPLSAVQAVERWLASRWGITL